VLFVGVLPVLLVPVQQDDLVFMLADNAASESYLGLIDSKFQQLLDLGRTNFLSAIGAGTHHFLIWHLGSATGLSLSTVEQILSFLWFAAATAAGAIFATAAFPRSSTASRAGAFSAAFFVLAAVVAGTIQPHSRWSNDPAVSYPAWGFGSATLAFLYLAALFSSLRCNRVTPQRLVGLAVLGLATVFWYEMNWVLLGAAMVAYSVIFITARHRRRRNLASFTALVIIPAVALITTRAYLLAHATSSYAGTEPHFGKDSIVAIGRGLWGSLPAAAWPLSAVATHQAGFLSLGWRPFASALALLIVVAMVVRMAWLRPDHTSAERVADVEPSWPAWLPLVTVVLYWIGTVCVFALTAKYAQELYRLGTVYAFYAPALVVLGIMVFAVLRRWSRRLPDRRLLVLVAAGTGGFVAVQCVLNWSLLDTQRSDMATASRLLSVADDPSATEQERCAAIRRFSASSFPFYAYPSDWMSSNLDILEQRRSGVAWCPGA
jgi:hypothetical protein